MKKILFIVLLAFITFNIKAQLVVNTGTMTPTQYVQNVLVGSGVTVSNVTFSGNAGQIGEFNAVSANVGVNNGLILSSGNVTGSVGPNNQNSLTLPSGGYGGAGDSDLGAIAGIQTFDAAVLEFDFIPIGDSIKFNYVFASEEYMQYANGNINDAFAFILSGVSVALTATNIALIPGTTTPVSLNTVNETVNSAYYLDNGDDDTWGSPPAPYSTDPSYIQYDGKTVVLTAKAEVICGETYHIKIAIADGFDATIDSGVFLEGGSFSSDVVLVDLDVPTLDVVNGMPVVIEGCSDAKINFTRPDVSEDATIHFIISGDAINGVDYNLISDSVTFLAGIDTASITIQPVIDGPDDFGQDTVTISYITVNPCGDTLTSEVSFLILDVPNLIVVASDTSICPISNISLSAEAFGAVAPFTYNWVNTFNDTIQTDIISGTSTVIVGGLVSDSYYLYVTDSCNLITTIDTINVYVNNDMASISTSGDTTLYCAGKTISISAFPDNVGNVYDYEWFDQIGGVGLGNDSVLTVAPVATITYYVTATNVCNGSTDTDTVDVIIDYTPIEITSITKDTTFQCLGNDYNLDLYSIVQNGTLPYSFSWYGDGISSDSLFQTVVNTPSTFYLDITDDCDLHALDTVKVTFAPYTPMTIETGSLDSICSGSEVELIARVGDGVAPYSFLWETGETTSSIDYLTSGSDPILVNIQVTDDCGQQANTSIELVIKLCDIVPMNVITPNGDGMNEFVTFINLDNYENSKLTVFNRWGKSVYNNDNYKNDWNGGKLNEGTYYYVLEVNDLKSTVLKGTFTLLK